MTGFESFFQGALRQLWSDWQRPLVYVQPDTVVRWQRERFRKFWARLSQPRRHRRGRPCIPASTRRVIEQMAACNPLWRRRAFKSELQMLDVLVLERTVSRIVRGLRRPPTQTWKTFLRNYVSQMVSIDFFTAPTVTMRVLFVFVVPEHGRRQVLHFNVTDHPASERTAQQIVEAFANATPSRYLLRDRDSIYGDTDRKRIDSLGLEELLTAPQSPWRNPYTELLAGSIRRECLNNVVLLNAKH